MKYYWIKSLLIVSLLYAILTSCSEKGNLSISILETTDIHGVILPYDFIDRQEMDVSLAHASDYIKRARAEKDALFLLDNGDNLQGQPSVYYYNFIYGFSAFYV